jgi:histidinol dehydrogenase
VRVERVGTAAELRALIPQPASVAADVERIVADVRAGGDAELVRYAAQLDGLQDSISVPREELERALDALDPYVRAGLEVACANVRAVADAWISDSRTVTLPEGHTVTVTETPVRRAAICAPGGRNPYPSSIVMGVVTARAAGVDEIVVCAPRSHPVMLAAAALCGADEFLRSGGAHTVAALAYGTATIARVDVIAGPGGPYVQEAKRRVFGDVGIDMFAGPSDLMIVAGPGPDDEAVVADLLAQAEHGAGSLAILVCFGSELLELAAERAAATPGEATVALLQTDDPLAAIEEFAPEHLQLVGDRAEALAPAVRHAGCILIGAAAGTAFSDYVAGSNHTLPTDGAARFASGLNPGHFRRRVSEIRIDPAAAARLARAGVPIAEAEGFPQHAHSMALRQNGEQ